MEEATAPDPYAYQRWLSIQKNNYIQHLPVAMSLCHTRTWQWSELLCQLQFFSHLREGKKKQLINNMDIFRVIDKLIIALPTNQSISTAVNTYPAMHVLQLTHKPLVLLTRLKLRKEAAKREVSSS